MKVHFPLSGRPSVACGAQTSWASRGVLWLALPVTDVKDDVTCKRCKKHWLLR